MTDLNRQEMRRLTVERDFMGAIHIKLGDFDFVQIQYQYPLTDNAGTGELARKIVEILEGKGAEEERDRLRAEVEALRKGVELLPLFTCTGKGGEYAKLGYAKPAGAIKTIQGDSGLIVYRDIKTGQLYFRDPRDFEQRMMAMAIMEPSPLGGDEVRELTTLDISTGAGKPCGGLGCCQLCADEAGEVGNVQG